MLLPLRLNINSKTFNDLVCVASREIDQDAASDVEIAQELLESVEIYQSEEARADVANC